MKFELHDPGPESGIFCDLQHMLGLLAPRFLTASWVVDDGDEGVETLGWSYGILETLGKTRERISGRLLQAIARKTTQVIWGDFIGYLPSDPMMPWVTFGAFDNSFWRIETEDAELIQHLRKSCRKLVEVTDDDF